MSWSLPFSPNFSAVAAAGVVVFGGGGGRRGQRRGRMVRALRRRPPTRLRRHAVAPLVGGASPLLPLSVRPPPLPSLLPLAPRSAPQTHRGFRSLPDLPPRTPGDTEGVRRVVAPLLGSSRLRRRTVAPQVGGRASPLMPLPAAPTRRPHFRSLPHRLPKPAGVFTHFPIGASETRRERCRHRYELTSTCGTRTSGHWGWSLR